MTGEYVANHKEREYSNTVPLAFEVASGDLNITSIENSYVPEISLVQSNDNTSDNITATVQNQDSFRS